MTLYDWKNYADIGPTRLLINSDGVEFPWSNNAHYVHTDDDGDTHLFNPLRPNNETLCVRFKAAPEKLAGLLLAHDIPASALSCVDTHRGCWPTLPIEHQSCFVYHLFESYADTQRERLRSALHSSFERHDNQTPEPVPCPF